MIKRLFDFLFSIIAIILLFPLFVFIAVSIKLTMPGPIFFIQERVGQNGRIFKLIKFRSMQVLNRTTKGSFDAGKNSRVTQTGKILRKTKLDEIPQLINVLKGEMSIVGPRPEVIQWAQVYPEKWKIVHSVKPGLSDNASIVFRNEEEILAALANPTETYKNEILPKKLNIYIDYVNNHSFWGDMLIILKTLKAIIVK